MNKQNILIYKLPELFNILYELKNNLDFVVHSFSKEEELFKFKNSNKDNYLILTSYKNEIKDDKFQIILSKFPDSIYSIIEQININLLKNNYLEKSDIAIGQYSIDINSRIIKNNDLNLKLTEREIDIIIFLKNSDKPQSIENLQKKVWGYHSDLETHTVETHIYRLRKKISETFNDSSFIRSTKIGYKI
tara:strand:- start:456 stop:1025 length:570 start_codon:yes stop_codon:yes gene_type:complete